MKSLLTKLISVFTILSVCVGLTACNSSCKTTDDKCADGHTWKLTSTTATCYDGGAETYTCEACNETKTEDIEAYGHDYVLTSRTEPTCKTNGEEVKKCSRCGFESKQTLLIIDHKYEVKSTTLSTCTMHGFKTFECSMCHEMKNETLPLLDHNYELVQTIPSTCTKKGANAYQCKTCTKSYSTELPLLEHNYELINETPSTCTVKGSKIYECSLCHDTYSDELPLEEHNYVLVNTTQSTCVEHGSKDFKCSVCHNAYLEELPLIDHKYEPVEVPATCFTHGATKEQCSVCKDEKNIQETPLLAHNFGADGYCEHCGIYETLFDIDKLNVSWGGTPIGTIRGSLPTKFNKSESSVPDSYWQDHIVTLTITMYDKDGDELESHSFTSATIPQQGANCGKLTIQYMDTEGGVYNGSANAFVIFLTEGNKYSVESRQNCKSFKIELSCDGYKTIEKTYNISEA